jgi:AraC family transcriptional regulator
MKALTLGQHFGTNKKTIRLNGIIYSEVGKTPDEVPWHYHENAYFLYQLRGQLEEVNKKTQIVCTPGTLLFHHWQDPHYNKNHSEDVDFFHLEIEKEWFLRYHLEPSILEGSMHVKNPVLKPIFQRIYKEIELRDHNTQLSVDGLLLQALAEIARVSQNEQSGVPQWVKKVQEILNDCISEKITLDRLAVETGIHPVHLSKEFPRYFTTGFGQYIRKIRIQKAAQLLADENLSISDIAYDCGFSDESHFIRCFREVIGTTPLKYRSLLR